jgi:hypothetical protein
VQWSSGREAVERTRVADERLEELDRLVDLRRFTQVPTAVKALTNAVVEATAAVRDAKQDGEPVPNAEAKLTLVTTQGGQTVLRVIAAARDGSLPLAKGTREAITDAATQYQGVLTPPDRKTGGPADAPPTPTTGGLGPDPTSATPPQPSTPQPPEPTTTLPPTTQTTPTTPTTTTEPPPSSDPEATPDSVGGSGAGGAAGEATPDEAVPATTVPGP